VARGPKFRRALFRYILFEKRQFLLSTRSTLSCSGSKSFQYPLRVELNLSLIAFKPKPAAPDPLCVPALRRVSDHYHLLLGMNQRQEGMAHKLSWGAGTHDDLVEAFCEYIEASREFHEALEAYREQLLKSLATKCPAAVRRIREGKPPRGRRKRPALRAAAAAE
jgi:hypothetical protein